MLRKTINIFFLVVALCLFCSFLKAEIEVQQKKRPFTVMLNPAGDAKDAGRMLNDSFERGVTLQCCQELKRHLETNIPNIRVVLTRFPGETLEPLQNANFANRLETDFYLSIHFYKEHEIKPHVYLYLYKTEHYTTLGTTELCFCPFDKAHLLQQKKTMTIGTMMEQLFKEFQKNGQFITRGLFTLPFRPLVGIQAPAIALEAGIKDTHSWQYLIEPIVETIKQIINK